MHGTAVEKKRVCVNVVKERLIDQADKRVPFMLRPAFKRELPTCILSTYCSPVVTGCGMSVPTHRCGRALSNATRWSYISFVTIKQLSLA